MLGRNRLRQLGSGAASSSYTPVAISGTLRFQSLAQSGLHAWRLTADGQAFCWGLNNYNGRLGDGTATRSTPPDRRGGERLPLPRAHDRVPAQLRHHPPGRELLLGPQRPRPARRQLPGAQRGAAPSRHPHASPNSTPAGCTAVGTASDQRVYCWGYNAFGQLGTGTANDAQSPVPVERRGSVQPGEQRRVTQLRGQHRRPGVLLGIQPFRRGYGNGSFEQRDAAGRPRRGSAPALDHGRPAPQLCRGQRRAYTLLGIQPIRSGGRWFRAIAPRPWLLPHRNWSVAGQAPLDNAPQGALLLKDCLFNVLYSTTDPFAASLRAAALRRRAGGRHPARHRRTWVPNGGSYGKGGERGPGAAARRDAADAAHRAAAEPRAAHTSSGATSSS